MNFDNSFGRKYICLLMLLTIMITATTAGFAQFDTAVVLGTVKDQNGAVLRGANITLKNNATGITATTQTDSNGNFAVPTSVPGAGMLEYQVSVIARARGHQSFEQIMPMPGGSKRLLIILVPGKDQYQPTRDVLRETLKMKDQIEAQ